LVLVVFSLTRPCVIGKRVTVVDYPDGRLAIRYKGVELAYRTFDSFARSIRAAGVSIGDNPR
jgi:hypothetical protein